MIRRALKGLFGRIFPSGVRPAGAVVPPASPTPTAPAEPEEDEAARFAHMECGAQELRERVEAGESVVLLDVRESYETAGGIIPGAKIIPLGQLQRRWEELKDANEVVCYCAAGMRSLQAAAFLREKGLINATSLEGGISAWMEVGGKVVQS